MEVLDPFVAASIPKVYSLQEVLAIAPEFIPTFLNILRIPASADNHGQIALTLKKYSKLSHPPLNTSLETLLAYTSPANRYNLIYEIDRITAPTVRPVSPVRSRPVSPVRSRPVSPVRSRPVSPVRSRPVSPVRSRPVSPVRSRPVSPVRSRPVSPVIIAEEPSVYTLEQIMSLNDMSIGEFLEDLGLSPGGDETGKIAIKLKELNRLIIPKEDFYGYDITTDLLTKLLAWTTPDKIGALDRDLSVILGRYPTSRYESMSVTSGGF